MAEKKQYNLRITEELIERLTKLGDRCGYGSGNEFAAEVLDQYAELLADLLIEQRKEAKTFREKQRDRLLKQLEEELEAISSAKSSLSNKPKRLKPA
jgi:predicted DNA-binding protein